MEEMCKKKSDTSPDAGMRGRSGSEQLETWQTQAQFRKVILEKCGEVCHGQGSGHVKVVTA